MKNIKIKFILRSVVLIGLLVGVAGRTQISFAQRSWEDGQVEKQNDTWEQEIRKWEKINQEWAEKRSSLHEQYFSDYDDEAKWCNESGVCYKEDILDMYIVRSDGFITEFEVLGNDVQDSEGSLGYFANGDKWECANGGQVLEFQGTDGTRWESGNEGQVLIYQDKYGNKWQSDNIGQGLTFTSASGEKWDVSNNGQVVEHTDSSGKTWDGSDDDDVDDMRWNDDDWDD